MQTQTINTDLCRWLDGKCQRIEQATSGQKRYGAFQSALHELRNGQGMAPVRSWPAEDGFYSEYAWDEIIVCLQALCWCALAEGVKTDTVKKAYETWERMIPVEHRSR